MRGRLASQGRPGPCARDRRSIEQGEAEDREGALRLVLANDIGGYPFVTESSIGAETPSAAPGPSVSIPTNRSMWTRTPLGGVVESLADGTTPALQGVKTRRTR